MVFGLADQLLDLAPDHLRRQAAVAGGRHRRGTSIGTDSAAAGGGGEDRGQMDLPGADGAVMLWPRCALEGEAGEGGGGGGGGKGAGSGGGDSPGAGGRAAAAGRWHGSPRRPWHGGDRPRRRCSLAPRDNRIRRRGRG